MHCPSCRHELNNIEVVDNFGSRFNIEQCSSCGGFWFDRNELYRIPIKVALHIDSPAAAQRYGGNLQCPHEPVLLTEFKDPNLPHNLTIFRCPACSGVFLFKGQLYAYKEYQAQRTLGSLMLSRKTIAGTSTLFAFLFFTIIFLAFSETIIRAEPLISKSFETEKVKTTSLVFSLLVLLVLLVVVRIYYNKRK